MQYIRTWMLNSFARASRFRANNARADVVVGIVVVVVILVVVVVVGYVSETEFALRVLRNVSELEFSCLRGRSLHPFLSFFAFSVLLSLNSPRSKKENACKINRNDWEKKCPFFLLHETERHLTFVIGDWFTKHSNSSRVVFFYRQQ